LTGSTGFLGSSLLLRLYKANYEVIALKRSDSDISRLAGIINKINFYNIDKFDVKKIFIENKVDCIIHTAVNYGDGKELYNNILQTNILFPLTLIEAGLTQSIKYFINTDTLKNADTGKLKSYLLSKKQFAEWLMLYKDRLSIINMIIHNMYGENDNEDRFIPYIIKNILNGTKNLDLPKVEQKRDFIYIDDICDAYIKIIENFDKLQTGFCNFEIGTGISTSVKDTVLLIKDIIKKNHININFGNIPYDADEIMDIKADITDINKLTGWKFKTTLKEGLKKTIDWHKKNMEQ